jgi:hypothetical protein
MLGKHCTIRLYPCSPIFLLLTCKGVVSLENFCDYLLSSHKRQVKGKTWLIWPIGYKDSLLDYTEKNKAEISASWNPCPACQEGDPAVYFLSHEDTLMLRGKARRQLSCLMFWSSAWDHYEKHSGSTSFSRIQEVATRNCLWQSLEGEVRGMGYDFLAASCLLFSGGSNGVLQDRKLSLWLS